MTEDELRALLAPVSSKCVECGGVFVARRGARTCSTVCRVAQHRGKGVPAFLVKRPRWVRWKYANGTKVPVSSITGQAVAITDPAEMQPFDVANGSRFGDGVGFVLTGDGLACYDLDDAVVDGRVTVEARLLVESIVEKIRFAELSPSGKGLHLWVNAPSAKGIRRKGFERYTRDRYVTVTGNRVSVAGLLAGAEIVGEIEKSWNYGKVLNKTSRRVGSSQKKTSPSSG